MMFKRKTTFTIAKCPECGGALELDSNLEIAHCKICGMTYLVENAPKKQKQGNFKLALDFIERQQALRRQDKIKKEEKKIERKKELQNEEQEIKKNWWIYLLAMLGIILLVFLISKI